MICQARQGGRVYTAQMPPPISLNSIFANARRGRTATRGYEAWKRRADKQLLAAGPRPQMQGPVHVVISIGVGGVSRRFDTDNAPKAYMDTLVRMGVLEDDNRTIVRSLAVGWDLALQGARITVIEV